MSKEKVIHPHDQTNLFERSISFDHQQIGKKMQLLESILFIF